MIAALPLEGMRRGKLRAAIAIVGATLLASAALSSAQTIYVEVGAVRTSFSASISPRALPSSKRAPIKVHMASKIVARDGRHIPAIARAEIGIDRSLTIDPSGVPVCSQGRLESQTTEDAEAACPAAIVGTGSTTVEIALDGGAPIMAESRLLAFNGGVAGRTTTFLIHAYLAAPVSQAVVVPFALTRFAKGGYGLRAQATIPKIASGSGSIARFDLTLRRQVATTAGGRHGYLLARCSDGNFVFEPEVEFLDGDLARGTLAQGCHPAR
jgi:hypothetical protein